MKKIILIFGLLLNCTLVFSQKETGEKQLTGDIAYFLYCNIYNHIPSEYEVDSFLRTYYAIDYSKAADLDDIKDFVKQGRNILFNKIKEYTTSEIYYINGSIELMPYSKEFGGYPIKNYNNFVVTVLYENIKLKGYDYSRRMDNPNPYIIITEMPTYHILKMTKEEAQKFVKKYEKISNETDKKIYYKMRLSILDSNSSEQKKQFAWNFIKDDDTFVIVGKPISIEWFYPDLKTPIDFSVLKIE